MTAFRFVTLVCDRCFAAFDPGTALAEDDARADAVARGWDQPSPGEDRCRACVAQEIGARPVIADELEIGVPILVPSR